MENQSSPHVWIAQPHEADTVAELLMEFRDWFSYEHPPDEACRKGVERLIDDPGTEFLLGSAKAGEPAQGVCQTRYRYNFWYVAEDCYLEDLFIRETWRGIGLGRAFIETVIDRSRQRGVRHIELDTEVTNLNAISLYHKLGFVTYATTTERELLMRHIL